MCVTYRLVFRPGAQGPGAPPPQHEYVLTVELSRRCTMDGPTAEGERERGGGGGGGREGQCGVFRVVFDSI